MMQTIRLFTYLKSIDLHLSSAKETIENIINFDGLISMKRFIVWDIKINKSSLKEAKHDIAKILESSFYLANPNKMAYTLDKLPKPKITLSTDIIGIKSFNKDTYIQYELKNKIKNKTGIELAEIKKFIFWECLIEKTKKDAFINQIIVSKSQRKGLLVNPLFEDFELVDNSLYFY